MNLADLNEEGGFVSDSPVLCTVTWKRAHLSKDDMVFDVWVRPMTAADFEFLARTPQTESRMAATIARLVSFGPDGKTEPVSPEMAAKLDPFLLLALTEAINTAAPPGKA